MEWYDKRKDYLDHNTSMGIDRDVDDDMEERFYGLEYIFESVLPCIAEPISSFKFEENKDMYRFLTKEMRGHVNRVSDTISEAMQKTDKEFPTAYHTPEHYKAKFKTIEDSMEDKPFPDDDTRVKTVNSIYRQKVAEEDAEIKAYIEKRAMQPYRDARLWRQQRIAQLQEELRSLTELEEYEKRQEEQASRQEKTQSNPEISQR
jgi:hypothetical protein